MRVPAVAYWKGMIEPGRVTDQLFDLADLFTTSAALAGVDYRPADDQYLDDIDQSSFLLADAGPVEPQVRILLAGTNTKRASCCRIQVHACRHVLG